MKSCREERTRASVPPPLLPPDPPPPDTSITVLNSVSPCTDVRKSILAQCMAIVGTIRWGIGPRQQGIGSTSAFQQHANRDLPEQNWQFKANWLHCGATGFGLYRTVLCADQHHVMQETDDPSKISMIPPSRVLHRPLTWEVRRDSSALGCMP